jgi:hypothetical protein
MPSLRKRKTDVVSENYNKRRTVDTWLDYFTGVELEPDEDGGSEDEYHPSSSESEDEGDSEYDSGYDVDEEPEREISDSDRRNSYSKYQKQNICEVFLFNWNRDELTLKEFF